MSANFRSIVNQISNESLADSTASQSRTDESFHRASELEPIDEYLAELDRFERSARRAEIITRQRQNFLATHGEYLPVEDEEIFYGSSQSYEMYMPTDEFQPVPKPSDDYSANIASAQEFGLMYSPPNFTAGHNHGYGMNDLTRDAMVDRIRSSSFLVANPNPPVTQLPNLTGAFNPNLRAIHEGNTTVIEPNQQYPMHLPGPFENANYQPPFGAIDANLLEIHREVLRGLHDEYDAQFASTSHPHGADLGTLRNGPYVWPASGPDTASGYEPGPAFHQERANTYLPNNGPQNRPTIGYPIRYGPHRRNRFNNDPVRRQALHNRRNGRGFNFDNP